MEEQIYKIIRIDEDDFGCEGRPEGQDPMCVSYWRQIPERQ